MTDPTRTLIAVLLDRSGSMETIKADTEGGFNAFIGQQRAAVEGFSDAEREAAQADGRGTA